MADNTRETRLLVTGDSSGAEKALNQTSKGMQDVRDKSEKLTTGTSLLASTFGILGTAVGGITLSVLAREMIETGIAADRMRNQMAGAFNSTIAGAQELQFISEEAKRLGLNLQVASSDYAQLAASARGTRLEGIETRKIFSSVSETATVMGLSADETSGALRALSQMMSKGTVQSEELRGQLGERIPGAFNMAARAMGVSTAELGKMLEQGKIMSDDLLPKLAAEMQRTYGDQLPNAVHSAQAEVNRFQTAMFDLKKEVMENGGKDVFVALTKGATSLAEALRTTVREYSNLDDAISVNSSKTLSWIGTAGLMQKHLMSGDFGKISGDFRRAMAANSEIDKDLMKKWNPMGTEEPLLNMIAAGRRADAVNASSGKKPDKKNSIFESWQNELIGIKAAIDEMQPGLSDLDKAYERIDKRSDQLLNKYGKIKGASLWIETLRETSKAAELKKVTDQMAISDLFASDAWLNSQGQMSVSQQNQFDQSAMLSDWAAKREEYRQQEAQAEFTHNEKMYGIAGALHESRLQLLGEQETALGVHYDVERQKIVDQMNWTLEHTALEEQEKNRIKEEAGMQLEQLEQERSERLGQLWWNNSQKYLGVAEQMTTMGLQMLLFDESQRSQIGKRMLATSIRFIAQGLQQFMFGKAQEHMIAAASAAGRTTMDTAAATANLTLLETQAVAWAAFLNALAMNPYGGQAVIPAAAAMTAVAGGVVPAAIGSVAATGAASVATELAMAGAWAAGGIAVGALGEGGASAIEGGTAGSTSPAGYGAGTNTSPVITQPATTQQQPQQITVVFQGNVMDQQYVEEKVIPFLNDAASRGVSLRLIS